MLLRRFLSLFVLTCFFNLSLGPWTQVHAASIDLPAPGRMVGLTGQYEPVMVKGLRINPDNPFMFDFIVDTGSDRLGGELLKNEGTKLAKYFLAALAIPEEDLWVNLSPYEKDKIIPPALSQTDMGRDLLAEDYILKQLTASLIYPEKELGKEFWSRVYAKAQQLYGSTDIPVNTFNKVWIMADRAEVYERGDSAFVINRHLKVMLEEDYLALKKHSHPTGTPSASHTLSSQIVREVVLPEIENEVNTGRNFASLRQIFNTLILAGWYKNNLKDALLNQVYANKAEVNGINLADPKVKEEIYQQYLAAYKKGVFNFIKDEKDIQGHSIPRKYFSGGVVVKEALHPAVTSQASYTDLEKSLSPSGDWAMLGVMGQVNGIKPDSAILTQKTPSLIGSTPALGMSPQQLKEEIQKELRTPGSGRIPLIAVVSDQHGTIDKFDALISDMLKSVPAGKNLPADFKLDPDQTLAQQLASFGIKLEDFKRQLFIHNLGDFMDRGPFGVKVYKRSKELIDAGLSDFVVGNHDQWMFMNLIGFHLPFYDNFQFYGYKDAYDSKKGGGDVRFLLAQKHRENPETRKAMWWAKRLAEFRKFHEDQQKTRWKSLEGQVAALFTRAVNGRSEDEKKEWYHTDAGHAWNKLRGFDPDVGDVATGVKAVGLVSIVWWEDLLKDFKSIYTNLYVVHQIEKDTDVQEAWKSTINLIENHIIPGLKETLEEHINPAEGESQWWWRVFEAIDSQNYTSPEWWAMDWAYHKGWGPTVFEEINNTYHNGEKAVTTSNYLDDNSSLKGVEMLKEIARFFKDHYTLHIKDVMQTDFMHAFLPIDPKTGEFYFNYKSRQYQGRGGNGTLAYWEGLQAIAQDIRNAPNDEQVIKTIYEAITVVNGWYADNTTQAKFSHVAKAFRDIGVTKLGEANDIHRLVTGHLPVHDALKLTELERSVITGHFKVSEDGQHVFAFSDGGMGERFGGGAKYLKEGTSGFTLRGFPARNSAEIIDNPNTIILKTDKATGKETEKKVYSNSDSMVGSIFLQKVLENITDTDAAMKTSPAESVPEESNLKGGIDLNTSNMYWVIKKEGTGIRFKFNPALVQKIQKEGIQSLTPMIYKVSAVADIRILLNMAI